MGEEIDWNDPEDVERVLKSKWLGDIDTEFWIIDTSKIDDYNNQQELNSEDIENILSSKSYNEDDLGYTVKLERIW